MEIAALESSSLQWLAESERALWGSPDSGPDPAEVAGLVVPRLAEWCALHLIDERRCLRRVAAAHVDPEAENRIRRLQEEWIVSGIQVHDHAALLNAAELNPSLILPLAARGCVLGVMMLGFSTPGHDLDGEDTALAEDLSRRATLAWDHARLARENGELRGARDLLQATLNALHDSVMIMDASGRVTYANEAQARNMGFHSLEEVVGMPQGRFRERAEAFREDGLRLEPTETTAAKVLRGEPTAIDIVRIHYKATGKDAWFEVRSVPIHDKAGKVCQVITTSHDVTHLKDTQHALQESKQRLQIALDSGRIGIWDYDLKESRVALSDRIFEFMDADPGTTTDDFESLFATYVHPGDAGFMRGHIQAATEGRAPIQCEFRLLRPSGETRWLHVGLNGRFDGEGRPVRIIGAAMDITDRKRAEEEVRCARDLLQKILNSLQDRVVVVDGSPNLLYANEAMARSLGCDSLQELLSIPVESVAELIEVYDETGNRMPPSEFTVVRAFRGEPVPYGLYRCRFPRTGEDIWVEARSAVFRDETGKVVMAISSSHDVTRLKAAQDALMAGEERLRWALEVGQIGICHYDIREDRIGWSDRMYEIHGLLPGKQPRRLEDFFKLIHPDDSERVRECYRRAMRERGSYHIDFRILRPSGEVRWRHTSGGIQVDGEGRPVRLINAATDITEQKTAEATERLYARELEKRVEERTAELRESLSEMEAFTYTVAHDLRAPLRAMRGFAELLQFELGESLDFEHQSFLRRIVEGVFRMDTLIQDLLAYSRIGREALPVQRVDMDGVVEDVLGQFREHILDREASVTVARPLPRMMGNPLGLTLVLSNLFQNALKFSKPGEAPCIRLRGERHVNGTRFWVEDDGIGIAAEHQDRVFRIFERLHVSDAISGTGVGLAIVWKAMERMGGLVGLESAEGRGSRFWIELPDSR